MIDFMHSYTSIIFAGFEWFMRVVKLNLLWLISCIAGLFIFSFYPVTLAAFAVADQWVKGNADVSIWETFKRGFKEKYWRSQALGLLITMGYFILYVDIKLFISMEGFLLKNILLVILAMIVFLFLTASLYLFPLTIQFDLGLKGTFKTALFTGLSYIHWTVINLLGLIGIGFISYRYPALFLFLTSGSSILWLTCMHHMVRRKVEMKYARLNAGK